MLVIITGTIRPSRKVGHLVLKNEAERLEQYKDALLFIVQSSAFSKIVFCENSGYGIEGFADVQEQAAKLGTELELMSFAGNAEQVIKHGKGYGEGEIMDHVFANSRILEKELYFVKITGRLKVVNIKNICERLNPKRCYFNIPNRTIRDYYDTKLYAMPTEVFNAYFRKAYDKVWDDKGIYLEKIYTEILSKEKIKVKNFPRYPRVIGMSGSLGYDYGYTECKCKVRDFIGLLGGYKIR